MLKISIPTPCHQDWGAMSPSEQGRHCSACAKTVVDFTQMNDEEVKYFFLQKKEEDRVCGRFKNEQLHRICIALPAHIFEITMPRWKQFLAVCLLAFSSMLFSCDTKVSKGEVIHNTGATAVAVIPAETFREKGVVGNLIIDWDSTLQIKSPDCFVTQGITLPQITVDTPEIITGKIQMAPLPPPAPLTLMGDTILMEPADTTHAIDPAKKSDTKKTDSAACANEKNIYL